MRNSLVLCLIISVSLLFTGSAVGQIVNGDFEAATAAPWGMSPSVATAGGKDVPHVYFPLALAGGGTKVAWLGDDVFTAGVAGYDPSVIYQFFNCGGTGTTCEVEFDAFFLLRDINERAFVYLWAGAGGAAFIIPPGFSPNVRVAVPKSAGGRAFVAFALYDPVDAPADLQSILLIDNVSSANISPSPGRNLEECGDCDTSSVEDGNGDPLPPDPGENDPADLPIAGTVPGDPPATGACCSPEGCILVLTELCEEQSFGKYSGDGTECLEECPDPIPAVSEWGMAVMILLLLSAATVVLVRRRTIVT